MFKYDCHCTDTNTHTEHLTSIKWSIDINLSELSCIWSKTFKTWFNFSVAGVSANFEKSMSLVSMLPSFLNNQSK